MPTINKPKRTTANRSGNHYAEARRKIYQTKRWARLRAAKIMDEPLCEICKKKGIYRPAEDVHHITSFMSTNDPMQRTFLAFDYSNLMAVCKGCHQKIHNSYGTSKENQI